MTLIYPFPAAGTDKNIFIVICHPDNLVRHDLTDGENQIMLSFHQQSVHLRRPRVIYFPFGDFLHKRTRHFSQRYQVFPPTMDAENIFGNSQEHRFDIGITHLCMRSECRQDIRQRASKVLIGE